MASRSISLVLGSVLPAIFSVGCASQIGLTVHSDPPGATITELETWQSFGSAPQRVVYEKSALAAYANEQGCARVKGFRARWLSGAATDVEPLQICRNVGDEQVITLRRDPSAPGYATDLEYAQRLMHAQRLAQLEAELRQAEAAMLLYPAAASLGQAIGCAAAGNCRALSSTTTSSTYLPSITAPTTKECSSDFSCGIGYTCVKAPLKTSGVCMKSVDEYGLRQFNTPSTQSVGPNLDLQGQCQFDTDCPVAFRCDRTYKACIKR